MKRLDILGGLAASQVSKQKTNGNTKELGGLIPADMRFVESDQPELFIPYDIAQGGIDLLSMRERWVGLDEPPVRGILKHLAGRHDQRTHGRRASLANGTASGQILSISDLDHEQKSVIRQYSGDYYAQINNKLRHNQEVSDKAEKLIPRMDKIMNNTSLENDKTLYRGAEWYRLNGEDIVDMRNDLKVGAIFQDNGFVSTTSDVKLRDGFTGLVAPVSYEILAPKGTKGLDISKLSALPKEKEVLLNRGTKFKITEIAKDGPDITDMWYVKMVVVNG